ncbi:D-alanine--D-alanine ligase [Gracilibacillus alcaliphilus]|uniref:D-alanine--D-alanine ligase n=1 Tax=Gracilibacillus alcaliphilus TaxID=1401441 RepID=UPI001958362F|nr:D-alanine--D-alanine ligase [Gracilibacillus alcaliphilus]MBM7678206.1 D-alanine-D-alanine ligase [Gracilibacillus alcaliphilus]
MKKKLHLLFGGKSAEHNVSLQTAKAVINAVDKDQYDIQPIFINGTGEWMSGAKIEGAVTDIKLLTEIADQPADSPFALTKADSQDVQQVVFPLLHGPNGEDGTVQGLLEILNLPYVGNGVLASSTGMDKIAMKALFAQAELPQVKYVGFLKKEWEEKKDALTGQIEAAFGYPCFVKPANLGSSVGINKCKDRSELDKAVAEALQFDRKVIVEEGVTAREIEMGVIGNDELECSVAGEIVPKTEFYDYQSKYEDGDTALIIPADIDEHIYREMKEMAIQAYRTLDCAGLARMDFFLTEDGRILINEVNTMPGFTPVSMFPLLWKHSGLDYPALINKLVELALEKHEEKMNIRYTMD